MTSNKPKKSCTNCKHRQLPADHKICIACWDRQRWKNWEPSGLSEADNEAD